MYPLLDPDQVEDQQREVGYYALSCIRTHIRQDPPSLLPRNPYSDWYSSFYVLFDL